MALKYVQKMRVRYTSLKLTNNGNNTNTMTPTTSFILAMPLAAIAWAVGNALIHRAYLLFESAKVSKVLTQDEKDDIKFYRKFAHIFWWVAMAFLSAQAANSFPTPNEKIGAALFCIACFWGVFGWVTKWMLSGHPLYLDDNWINSLFKWKGGLLVMTLLQIALGVFGVVLLN